MAFISSPAFPAEFIIATESVPWEQVDEQRSFLLVLEREEFSNLDRAGRFVLAVQVGRSGPKLNELSAWWQAKHEGRVLGEQTIPIEKGLVAVSFNLEGLKPGRYEISAELRHGQQVIGKAESFFRYVLSDSPPARGRIALNLPNGVPLGDGTYPITCGIPFPKGALADPLNVRLVKADGTTVPCQTVVRSRWGHRPDSSIRWLGLDFQAEAAPPWWPQRKDTRYYLEFGPEVKPAPLPNSLRVAETADGILVDTGPLQFLVRRHGFNLLDEVRLNNRPILRNEPRSGLYLVDHEGAIYRAANDRETKLTLEEAGPIRATLRVEGWYVKDGTAGEKLSYTLPTDKLCKFITRIEAYAGKPYVRVLSTWILTFDSFTVRLRDVGLALPFTGCGRALFGVEEGEPIRQPVPAQGVYLIHDLPHRFLIEDGTGKVLHQGKHSAGWMLAEAATGILGLSHRETWQRFPKEMEVLPDEIRFHVWPAHGRSHPEIHETEHPEIHKLWFAHQGKELNLAMPWEYYLAVARIVGDGSTGVYSGPGLALAGVHSSAMGVAITSDLLLHFAEKGEDDLVRRTAQCFQARPHALPDCRWTCESLALGWMHPYDPEHMKDFEAVIENALKGYWETQNHTDQYGMWLYRVWHHTRYNGDGKWELYRLYNATHHYEAFMPWMLYARSGDPFYLMQGAANIRQLTDVQVIHYDDRAYPHEEFHFGQKRIVGSTKHTNGFNTWGGDHALLAHLTCYNAIILAHYLTGDLRLREVVVDEWQRSIVSDRANPEFSRAIRLQPGRDNNNSLGELIDLYQLTYHPALLAHIGPALERFLQNMYGWGQPLHNVLLFMRNSRAREQLLEGCRQYRANAGKPKDTVNLWFTHAPHENFALAAICAPEENFHIEAYWAVNPIHRLAWAEGIRQQLPRAVTWCTVPDLVVYMPRVLHAVARAGGKLSLEQLAVQQPLPAGDMTLRGWMRCIVREDQDREFQISLTGRAGPGGAPLKLFGPDNAEILSTTVPEGEHFGTPYKITVPKDGKTGQYVIFLKARDGKEDFLGPITDLPGEVYCPGYWFQRSATRYFTRSQGEVPETIQIQPHASGGSILDFANHKLLASTSTGEWISAQVGPEGVLIEMRSRYVHLKHPIILSLTPSRWFVPDSEKMKLSPEK